MATIPTTVPALAGTVLNMTAATAGVGADQYRNTGKEMLVVNNGSAGVVNVTFIAVGRCSGGVLHDITQAVAIGATEYFPPPDPAYYTDENGMTKLTFAAAASVTRGVISPT